MKNRIRLTLALALLCAAFSTASYASSLYVVQALPGRNLAAATDPAYPVDVLLNDEVCYLHGVTFGTVAGPLTFEPGSYNVKVSIANSLAPCSNTPLVEKTVTIETRTDMSAVLTLDAAGAPALLTFTNNLAPVPANMARVLFTHVANAPALQLILQNTATMKLYTFAVKPGALLDVNLPAGNYTVEVNQGTTTLVVSTPLNLYAQSATLLYAAGQASNNSVILETRIIRDVI
jgi:hypothetical protein